MAVCKVTDPYDNEQRNKRAISITVKRADYESKERVRNFIFCLLLDLFRSLTLNELISFLT